MLSTLISSQSQFISADSSAQFDPATGSKQFQRFVKHIFSNMPENSQKAIQCDWSCYLRFISSQSDSEFQPIPLTDHQAIDTMHSYVKYLSERFKVKTIRRRLHHLKVLFSYFGCPNPLMTNHELKKTISLVIKKVAKPAGQAEPLSATVLQSHLEQADLSNLKTLRDMIIVNLAYDTLCRCSELRVVQLEHVTESADGDGTLFVERTKSDREAIGAFRYVSKTAMGLIRQWQNVTGIKGGYLLRALTSSGTLKPYLGQPVIPPVSYEVVVAAFKSVNVNLTGHSARVGAAVDMVKRGTSLEKIQLAGGWRDPGMILHYSRKTAAKHSAAADMAKALGR